MKRSAADPLRQLAAEIFELEQRNGVASGSTRIVPLVSETAAAALTIPDYVGLTLPRLAGLMWGAEDLSAALGASRKYGDDGNWTDAFRMVRATVLLTAHARGVAAIDTLHADFRDEAGLIRMARAARTDGFSGMLAIHPGQVPVINAAFTPSEEELAGARALCFCNPLLQRGDFRQGIPHVRTFDAGPLLRLHHFHRLDGLLLNCHHYRLIRFA